MKGRKLIVAVGGVGAAALIAGGLAFAAWSVSGSGDGGATATVASTLTITQIDPSGPAANLYPGGVSGVYFTVNNPNPFGVTLTGISYGTPTSNDTETCASSNVSIDAAAPTTVSIPVAADTTSSALEIGGVLDMAHSAPVGCEGVSFTVPITATGVQQ